MEVPQKLKLEFPCDPAIPLLGIYPGKTVVETWMDLESVIQSEVNQKEKNKYHILTHICGIKKNGTDEPICSAGIETHVENRCVNMGKGKEGGMNWEIGIDIYTLPCVK